MAATIPFFRGIKPQVALSIALMLSLVLHFWLFFFIRDMAVGFGPPMIDPDAPIRFKLIRPQFNPEALEATRPKEPSTPSQIRPLSETPPETISAFEGPLNAPRVPVPRLMGEPVAPLSAGPAPVPVDAFSALPQEPTGNLPTLAQALANDASTAALREATDALKQGSLAGGSGGRDTTAGGNALPKMDDISSMLNFRSAPNLTRPQFQPILLRLSSDVLFEFDSATLQPTAVPTLQRVALILASAVRTQITIEGHTDTFGTDDYNQRLSLQRAQAVADWLKAQPSLANRVIQVRGFGKTRPIVSPNGTIDEQKQNRRVEVRVEAEK